MSDKTEYKCRTCGTDMNVYNQIKLDMIDNPYVGRILFECPNCGYYRRISWAIKYMFEVRDKIDAGESVLGCDNFDDFLKKLEEQAWNDHIVNCDELFTKGKESGSDSQWEDKR